MSEPGPSAVSSEAETLALLARLRADQQERWQRGERVPAEAYRQREPRLLADSETFLDLVFSEFVLRESLGECPSISEYVWRFPDFERQLYLQVAVHRALSASDTPELTPAHSGILATPFDPAVTGYLGPYRILQQLGAGGMGVVFEAEDTALQRRVALKILPPGTAATPATRARLLREARAAASLQDDHIVTIYQVGEDQGVPFLAMQLLAGMTLEARLQGPVPLTPREILRFGKQIALGLAAAHEKGLIHRDIKPANLWLEPGECGRIKILDFGLVHAIEEDPDLTATGLLLGTPAYMAPEQASGGAVDARCDLFSLGVVLYRLCSGRLPFEGSTSLEVLTSLAARTPPVPVSPGHEFPSELIALVMQLLEKDPANRPPSARAVADSLARLEQETATGPKASSLAAQPRVRRTLWSIPAAALVLMLPLGYFPEEPPPRPRSVPSHQAAREQTQDPDRRAARYVLDLGGQIRVRTPGSDPALVAELPREDFQLTHVVLRDNKGLTNAGLAHFQGCKHLEYLNLYGTQVGDPGLVDLENCQQLRYLNLSLTNVGDSGLAHLKRCTALHALHLRNTRVTDVGLAHLDNCKELIALDLQRTATGDAGLACLAARHRLRVLYLDSTSVSDAGIEPLKRMNALEYLSVSNSKITLGGVAALRSFLPRCKFDADRVAFRP